MKVGITTAMATSQGLDRRGDQAGWSESGRHDGFGVVSDDREPSAASSGGREHDTAGGIARRRAGGRFVDADARRHRQADEQRRLVGVVVEQVDAHGQTLDDLDEIARRVLRREKRQRRAGADGEAGDAALELLVAAVHVDFDVDRLADPQLGELGFLEVGVDPDVGRGSGWP